ncbi:hypothetical protein C8R47DRAFT_716842 [Mycena vitilis]|nr:hypothetical protein C8R47DRAFT_716842 [Mycena vitilis]
MRSEEIFPKSDILSALYPTLRAQHHRKEAWIADNNELFREAIARCIAAHPEDFPRGASVDPSGSIFSCHVSDCYHCDPITILHRHQGFTYKMLELWNRPVYVAAEAYILANYDAREAWKPITITVPEGWHPGVWPYQIHPDEQALHSPPGAKLFDRVSEIPAGLHDPVRFPLMRDVRAAAKAAGKLEQTRYTIFGWRKMEEREQTCWDILAKQRYLVEHFDLKQVLDEEKRVLSTEWAPDYEIETEMPRL